MPVNSPAVIIDAIAAALAGDDDLTTLNGVRDTRPGRRLQPFLMRLKERLEQETIAARTGLTVPPIVRYAPGAVPALWWPSYDDERAMLIPAYATGAVHQRLSSLFLDLQPLFTKMVLPLLGGRPTVWNTAMMFFQLMLLAGYFYAHILTNSPAQPANSGCMGPLRWPRLGFLPIGVAAGRSAAG